MQQDANKMQQDAHRVQCLGKTKTGAKCTKITKELDQYCHLHKSQKADFVGNKNLQNDANLSVLCDNLKNLKIENKSNLDLQQNVILLNLEEFKNLEQNILDSNVNEINKNTQYMLEAGDPDDVYNYIKYLKDFTVQYNPNFVDSMRLNTISVLDSLINLENTDILNRKIRVGLETI